MGDISRREFFGDLGRALIPIVIKKLPLPKRKQWDGNTDDEVDKANYHKLFGYPGDTSDRARRAAEYICDISRLGMADEPLILRAGIPWERILQGVEKTATLLERHGIPPERGLGNAMILPLNVFRPNSSGYANAADSVLLGNLTLNKSNLPNIVLHELIHRLFGSSVGRPGKQRLLKDYYYGQNQETDDYPGYTWEGTSKIPAYNRLMTFYYPGLRDKAPCAYGADDAREGYPIEYPTTVIQGVADRYDGKRDSWFPNRIPDRGITDIISLLQLMGNNAPADPDYKKEAYPIRSYDVKEIEQSCNNIESAMKGLAEAKDNLYKTLAGYHNIALSEYWKSQNPLVSRAEQNAYNPTAKSIKNPESYIPEDISKGNTDAFKEAIKYPIRRSTSTAYKPQGFEKRIEAIPDDIDDLMGWKMPAIAWKQNNN